jgi:hypothetical protein
MTLNHSISDYTQLLTQLLKKVTADPELKADLVAAQTTFTGGDAIEHSTANSFNEWYLLERSCPILGAPPAVAWAPKNMVKDDIWHCLLDSFFGLFYITSIDDEADIAILECLWSARQVRVNTLPSGLDEGTFIPARVAQSDSESHLLLPSANFIVAPDLLESISHDLRELRGTQPRARLSQLEWHRLFSSQQQALGDSVAQNFDDLLASALDGQEALTVDSVKEMLAEIGVADTLDKIAFDTDLELEPFRLAFSSIEGSDQSSDNSLESDGEGLAEAVAEFLASDSSGALLEDAFDKLETDLELEQGSTGLLSEDSEATGVDEVPGVEMWLRSYLFDSQIAGTEVSSTAGSEIESFLNYCANAADSEHLDPHQLMPSTVLAYMMGSTDLKDLQSKVGHLDDFVMWLANEQDAPLQDIVPLSGTETNSWLQDLIACNSALQSNGVDANSLVDVSCVEPLQTLDDSGLPVAINNFPGDYLGKVLVGDKLMGCWKEGEFAVAAWMPQRLLPATK